MAGNKSKVLVAMSGGVDSSVAAALLVEQRFNVVGVTMKIWSGEASPTTIKRHGCYGSEEAIDIEDARRVAQSLGIPFHVIDLTEEYQREVLDYFRREYLSGRTPNPCVRCNPIIKFGALLDKAHQSGLGFDHIASGHYARIEYDDVSHRYLLKKARDLTKDQTYFLSFLSQHQFSQLMLPLGDYTKMEVRKMAEKLGLGIAKKPDSQNFTCGGYEHLLNAKPHPGFILDKKGNRLRQHRGISLYTIGQRKGLGLTSQKPLYVTELDSTRNTLTVGEKEDVFKDECTVSDLNWIAVEKLEIPMKLSVKIRSSHREAEALLTSLKNVTVRVKFKEPQLAITPGQAAVFYHGDTVIGGGIIKQ